MSLWQRLNSFDLLLLFNSQWSLQGSKKRDYIYAYVFKGPVNSLLWWVLILIYLEYFIFNTVIYLFISSAPSLQGLQQYHRKQKIHKRFRWSVTKNTSVWNLHFNYFLKMKLYKTKFTAAPYLCSLSLLKGLLSKFQFVVLNF